MGSETRKEKNFTRSAPSALLGNRCQSTQGLSTKDNFVPELATGQFVNLNYTLAETFEVSSPHFFLLTKLCRKKKDDVNEKRHAYTLAHTHMHSVDDILSPSIMGSPLSVSVVEVNELTNCNILVACFFVQALVAATRLWRHLTSKLPLCRNAPTACRGNRWFISHRGRKALTKGHRIFAIEHGKVWPLVSSSTGNSKDSKEFEHFFSRCFLPLQLVFHLKSSAYQKFAATSVVKRNIKQEAREKNENNYSINQSITRRIFSLNLAWDGNSSGGVFPVR